MIGLSLLSLARFLYKEDITLFILLENMLVHQMSETLSRNKQRKIVVKTLQLKNKKTSMNTSKEVYIF